MAESAPDVGIWKDALSLSFPDTSAESVLRYCAESGPLYMEGDSRRNRPPSSLILITLKFSRMIAKFSNPQFAIHFLLTTVKRIR